MSTLHSYYFAQSASAPERPALVINGRTWSYAELAADAMRVCDALRGACPSGVPVATLCSKSAVAYAAMLGIMASGHVYVPLSRTCPPRRNTEIIENAGCAAIVIDTASTESALDLLRDSDRLTVLLPDAEAIPATLRALDRHTYLCGAQLSQRQTSASAGVADDSASTAYIIHTSGSTGKPKGVPISHHSACLCIENLRRLMPVTRDDAFTQFAELSFDFSIGEIFLCWASGGRLCVPSAVETQFPLGFVNRQAITVWSSVPTIAHDMKALGVLRAGSLPSLRVSYFCGEALPTELAHAWSRAAPHSTVINLYGPTEAAVFSTAYTFDAAHHSDHVVVPIGTPLDGMRCLVVDEAGEPVDRQGAVGELLLSGPQVASGYWRDEPATRAAFVRRAYDGSERTWYKTGDLVSDHPDDGLLFHGRRDHQVKVRGYRAELLEVEQAVTRATGCERVAVVPRLSADGRCETLIAFCSGLRATEPEVKAACAALLPPQMVPGRFVELSPLPRNANGKVDYTQLRMIAASHVA